MIYFADITTLGLTTGIAMAGAAAMSAPIVIHLLTRYRRRREAWGAMRFLLEAFKKHRTRLKLEQILLLVVRCLIVGLLGLALSAPMLEMRGCSALGMIDPIAGRSRVVHLILDDSLSTQTFDPDGAMRFEQLKKTAMAVIESLDETDRVAVWLSARPCEALLAPASVDHAAAVAALRDLKPRFSPNDLPTALVLSAKSLTQSSADASEQALVMVLSDFAAGSLALDQAPPAQADHDNRVSMWIARPMSGRANVQIQSFAPRRRLILNHAGASGASPSAALELTLRRYDNESADEQTQVTLAVMDQQGQPILVRQREHVWSAGQTTATMQMDLPLAANHTTTSAIGAASSGGRTVVIRASIESDPLNHTDALFADNHAWTIVELQSKLRVALIDGSVLFDRGESTGLYSGKWISMALTPLAMEDDPAGDWPVEIIQLSAENLSQNQLTGIDAALTVRPDRLGDQGWSTLREFSNRGGLAWFFTPTQDHGASAIWGAKLTETFDLTWRIGLHRLEADQTAESDSSEEAVRWSLMTDPDRAATPELLRMLAADWTSLLEPVRIDKRIALDVQQTHGVDQTVWLRLNDTAQSPLLATASVGDGRVMLLATAIDTSWTNLPTKPLFVPLMHETLRSVLGQSPRLGRLSELRVGETLSLDADWLGAEQLLHQSDQSIDSAAPDAAPIMLKRTEVGLTSAKSADQPGVYTAAPQPTHKRLAVNLIPRAGDTRAIDQTRLESWLNALGQWDWLDHQDPAAALRMEPDRLALARPLLLAVLLLVIVETMLARWFSHANTREVTTLAQLTGWVRRLHRTS